MSNPEMSRLVDEVANEIQVEEYKKVKCYLSGLANEINRTKAILKTLEGNYAKAMEKSPAQLALELDSGIIKCRSRYE